MMTTGTNNLQENLNPISNPNSYPHSNPNSNTNSYPNQNPTSNGNMVQVEDHKIIRVSIFRPCDICSIGLYFVGIILFIAGIASDSDEILVLIMFAMLLIGLGVLYQLGCCSSFKFFSYKLVVGDDEVVTTAKIPWV
jgi:hypothetical protein